jgi:hypothetical protein
MILRAVLPALILLSGAAIAAPSANPFNDRIRALSPELQRATMRQAITNNGKRCGRVDRARFQQPYGNLMMWTAHCTPGGHFGIFVGRDQSVQVRRCEETVQLKLPRCAA